MRRGHGTIGAALLLASATLAAAQERVEVRFAPGTSGATVNGAITGDEYVDYVVGAQAGQTLVADLAVTGTNGNGSAMFNIVPAGRDFPALYNGSTEPDRRAEVVLPETGDWAVRVYLMGNDRDAGATVGFALDLSVPAAPGAGSSEAARTIPEEDFFVVAVSGGGSLNIRSAPDANAGIVGRAANGTNLRNVGGCTMSGGAQWCEIQPERSDVRGWVAARFLTLPGPSGDGTAQRPGSAAAERVAFPQGATGTEVTGQLMPQAEAAYLLGASDGQMLYVRLAANGPGMAWRIFNPDGSLLDEGDAAKEYRGQLFQSGDHRVEVRNTANGAQSFDVVFGIE